MAQQFRLELKEGPDNIKKFTENASQTFKRGEMIKATGTGTAADVTHITASVSASILGVAAKNGVNNATPAANEAEVYVVSPEQLWAVHVESNKKPNTAFTLGANYKIDQLTATNFTITREAETASTTVSMRGPVLRTTAATTASQGVVLVDYADEATKGKKGQKVIVRFAPDCCQSYKGR